MPNYPVIYVGQHSTGWATSGSYTSDITLNVPTFPATGTNFFLTVYASGYGLDSKTLTFHDSDGTEDTDWTQLTQGGLLSGHQIGRIYYHNDPPNASDWDNVELHVRSDGEYRLSRLGVQVWENVRQIPSCDTVISTASTSAHAPHSTGSMMVGWGYSLGVDIVYYFGAWDTDCTYIDMGREELGPSSGDDHAKYGIGFANPNDTASSDYLLALYNSQGAEYRDTFEIYPHEIDLQAVSGTVTFNGLIDWSRLTTLIHPAFEGTLSFNQNMYLRFYRVFESVLSFTQTLGKKTSKFPSGVLRFTKGIVPWRFIYEKIKYTIQMWLGQDIQNVETNVRLAIGSTDQAVTSQIDMPLDDSQRR